MKMRKGTFLMAFVLVLLFLTMLGTQLVSTVKAEMTEGGATADTVYSVEEGLVEGVGTRFEVLNSPYLNVALTSTETVRVILESVPRVVSFLIESNSSATSTVLTFAGFEPSTTYYRYQDGHLMENFNTDSGGGYTYTQDISQNHHVFIQENPSTIGIHTNRTFTSDVYTDLFVGADNITIDGNGHTLQGPGTGWGFYLLRRRGVTIKNFVIKGWTHGMNMYYSEFNKFINNTLSNNWWSGATLWLCHNNVFVNNTIINNGDRGLIMFYSGPNTLRNNTFAGNRFNFGSRGGELEWLAHDIDTSNTVDGKPIYYLTNQNNIIVDPSTFPNAGYVALVNCVNVTVRDLHLTRNREGVLFAHTINSTIENVTVSSTQYGLHLFDSHNNIIRNNLISDNWWGAILWYETPWFYPPGSSNNKIYHNNFVSNSQYQASSRYATNWWDDGYPSGGNYWSDYAGVDNYSGVNQNLPGSDGIGDTRYKVLPLHLHGVEDRYPFMKPLHLPSPIVKMTVRAAWLKYPIDWDSQASVVHLIKYHQLKPAEWKIEWGVIDLKTAPKEDFLQFDIIVATGRQNYTLTPEDNEKLSYFVENGGTLWIDNDRGLQFLGFFMPVEFTRYPADPQGYGYRVQDIIAPNHPLIKGIYTITSTEAHKLGGKDYIYHFYVVAIKDPSYVEIIRDRSVGNPVTLAGKYGDGNIVITSQAILHGVHWMEADDFKLVYNIMALAIGGKIDGILTDEYLRTGLAGTSVALSTGATVSAGSDGSFTFTKVSTETYTVTQTLLAGYGTHDQLTKPLEVTAGKITTVSLTQFKYVSIYGYVTNSIDYSPLSGVRVDLSGGASGTYVTDSSGLYRFSNIDPSLTYTVTLVTSTLPPNWASYGPTTVTLNNLLSDYPSDTQVNFKAYPLPLMLFEKIADKVEVMPGDYITYTLYYDNIGPGPAKDVNIKDVLPSLVVYISVTPSPTFISGGTLTWNIGDVESGGSGTITLVVQASLLSSIGEVKMNSATIHYGDYYNNPQNPESDSAETMIVETGATYGDVRTVGFWKHQVYLAITGKSGGTVSRSELLIFLEQISASSDYPLYQNIHVAGDDQQTLLNAYAILKTPTGTGSMKARAEQQLLATWLNLARHAFYSNTRLSSETYGEYGLNMVGEAIIYCESILLNPNSSSSDYEKVKTICDNLNNSIGIIW